jgi:hypothetical protein
MQPFPHQTLDETFYTQNLLQNSQNDLGFFQIAPVTASGAVFPTKANAG